MEHDVPTHFFINGAYEDVAAGVLLGYLPFTRLASDRSQSLRTSLARLSLLDEIKQPLQ